MFSWQKAGVHKGPVESWCLKARIRTGTLSQMPAFYQPKQVTWPTSYNRTSKYISPIRLWKGLNIMNNNLIQPKHISNQIFSVTILPLLEIIAIPQVPQLLRPWQFQSCLMACFNDLPVVYAASPSPWVINNEESNLLVIPFLLSLAVETMYHHAWDGTFRLAEYQCLFL